MGMIQSGINSAISGTAFMLGVTGATQQMREEHQYKAARKNLEKNVDALYDAYEQSDQSNPNVQKAFQETENEIYNQAQALNLQGMKLGKDQPSTYYFNNKVTWFEAQQQAREHLADSVASRMTQEERLKALENDLKEGAY